MLNERIYLEFSQIEYVTKFRHIWWQSIALYNIICQYKISLRGHKTLLYVFDQVSCITYTDNLIAVNIEGIWCCYMCIWIHNNTKCLLSSDIWAAHVLWVRYNCNTRLLGLSDASLDLISHWLALKTVTSNFDIEDEFFITIAKTA